jgi:hypothetical protein
METIINTSNSNSNSNMNTSNTTFDMNQYALDLKVVLRRNIKATMFKANADLLRSVAADYGLDVNGLMERYLSSAKPRPKAKAETKKPKAEAPKKRKAKTEAPKKNCTALNCRKKPCKRAAMADEDVCKIHARVNGDKKAPSIGSSTIPAEEKARQAAKEPKKAKVVVVNDKEKEDEFDALFEEAVNKTLSAEPACIHAPPEPAVQGPPELQAEGSDDEDDFEKHMMASFLEIEEM